MNAFILCNIITRNSFIVVFIIICARVFFRLSVHLTKQYITFTFPHCFINEGYFFITRKDRATSILLHDIYYILYTLYSILFSIFKKLTS